MILHLHSMEESFDWSLMHFFSQKADCPPAIFHGFQMQVSWPVASSAWSTWRPEGFQHGTLGDSFVLVGKGGLFVEFTKGESEAWTWQFLLTQNVQYQPQFIHPSSCLWDCSNFWYWIICRFDLNTAGCISNLWLRWCNISTAVADMG